MKDTDNLNAKTPSHKLKGIAFDLDGTLVDSLSATFEAFNHGITSFGGRKHTPQEIMEHFGTGEVEIFAKLIGPEKALQAYQACRAYIDENMHQVPLHSGVGDVLERLKSNGVPISIVTGRGWETTELILKHHRILDRFITVVADDHVSNPKPSPEGLHLALRRMKLEPHEALFVGDSPMDMGAARAAGAHGVAALWDLLSQRELMEPYEPRHWAEKPVELWEIWLKHR